MLNSIKTILFVTQLIVVNEISSQGWEQIYRFDDFNYGISIYNSQAGGFAFFSHSLNYDSPEQFIQVDAEGKILKNVEFDKLLNTFYFAFSATCQLTSGEYIVAGKLRHDILDPENVFLMKINASGQMQWIQEYTRETSYSINAVSETEDGGLILTGVSYSSQRDSLLLLKTDSVGVFQWEKHYGDIKDTRGNDVIQCSDGGFAVIGSNWNGHFGAGQSDFWLLKTDSNGELLWSKKFGDGAPDLGYSLLETENQGFILTGSGLFPMSTDGYSDVTVIKTDSLGNKIWIKSYERSDHSYAYAIEKITDGGYILCGQLNDSLTTGFAGYLVRIDDNGQLLWSQSFSGGDLDLFISVIETPDNGFGIVGYHRGAANSDTDLYVVKTDSLGRVLSSSLEGSIFWDKSQDCVFQSGEPPSDHFIIKASGKRDILGTSDTSGKFLMRLDTGTYQIKVFSPNNYWEACPSQIDIVALPNDTSSIEFAMQETVSCPYLSVSVSTPFLRRCFPGTYNVNYCNRGTALATKVQISVQLDSFMLFTSSSIPFSLMNNVYTFSINDLEPGDCGSFSINFTLSCEAELGMTHCINVSILPDTICVDGIANLTHTKECQINKGSYDPNDKRAFVGGREHQDTISQDIPIEYQIRFQNTGTDTAFRVIIIDTIQEELDIYSVIPGASSHPYSFELIGSNIIRFTFDDIILPDSFINEPASNGFVKFMINQKSQLPFGTVINNTANIYFDFNSPVATQLSKLIVEKVITSIEITKPSSYGYHLFPNPTTGILTIDIPWCEEKVMLKVFDLTGKLVVQSEGIGPRLIVSLETCIPGLYFYQLDLENGYLGGGTFIYH